MPRSTKDSDDDSENKTGRKLLRTSSLSVVDSPLRRSSRNKPSLKVNDVSPESGTNDTNHSQNTRVTRSRLNTMDSNQEGHKTLRSRKLSASSDVSETAETESHVDSPLKRNTRRSLLLSTELNKSDVHSSKRYKRAGSETKSPPPVVRNTRRTRASSMDPEPIKELKSKEQLSSTLVHTSVKTRKRTSILPSQSTVKEEVENVEMSDLSDIGAKVFPDLDNHSEDLTKVSKLKETTKDAGSMLHSTNGTPDEKKQNDDTVAEPESVRELRLIIEKCPVILTEYDHTNSSNKEKEQENLINQKKLYKSEQTINSDTIKSSSRLNLNESFSTYKQHGENVNISAEELQPTINMEKTDANSKVNTVKDIPSNLLNTHYGIEVLSNTKEENINEHHENVLLNEIQSAFEDTSDNKPHTDLTKDNNSNGDTSIQDDDKMDISIANDKSIIVDTFYASQEHTIEPREQIDCTNINNAQLTTSYEGKSNVTPCKDHEASAINNNKEEKKTNENHTNIPSDVISTLHVTTDNKHCQNLSVLETSTLTDGKPTSNTNLNNHDNVLTIDKDASINSDESIDVETNTSDTVRDPKNNTVHDIQLVEHNDSNYNDKLKLTDDTLEADAAHNTDNKFDFPDNSSEEIVLIQEDSREKLEEDSNHTTEHRNSLEKSPQSTLQHQTNVSVDDSNLDTNIESLFKDIPAHEWQHKGKRNLESETSSVYSVITEKLENESEGECDLMLVDRESWLSAENLKETQGKELLEYDSDDTVILKSQLNSLQEDTSKQTENNETGYADKEKVITINKDSSINKRMKSFGSDENLTVLTKSRTSSIFETSNNLGTSKKSLANVSSIVKLTENNESSSRILNISKQKSVQRETTKNATQEEGLENNRDISVDQRESCRKNSLKNDTKNSTISNISDGTIVKKSVENMDKSEDEFAISTVEQEIKVCSFDKALSSDSASLNSSRNGTGEIPKEVTQLLLSNCKDVVENKEQNLSKSQKNSSEKRKSKNYSTLVHIGSNSEEDGENVDSESINSENIPKFLFCGASSSDNECSENSINSDIEKEYNLQGISRNEDDDIPGDECRDSESELSDPNDNGSDLADFVVDDDDDDDDDDEMKDSEGTEDGQSDEGEVDDDSEVKEMVDDDDSEVKEKVSNDSEVEEDNLNTESNESSSPVSKENRLKKRTSARRVQILSDDEEESSNGNIDSAINAYSPIANVLRINYKNQKHQNLQTSAEPIENSSEHSQNPEVSFGRKVKRSGSSMECSTPKMLSHSHKKLEATWQTSDIPIEEKNDNHLRNKVEHLHERKRSITDSSVLLGKNLDKTISGRTENSIQTGSFSINTIQSGECINSDELNIKLKVSKSSKSMSDTPYLETSAKRFNKSDSVLTSSYKKRERERIKNKTTNEKKADTVLSVHNFSQTEECVNSKDSANKTAKNKAKHQNISINKSLKSKSIREDFDNGGGATECEIKGTSFANINVVPDENILEVIPNIKVKTKNNKKRNVKLESKAHSDVIKTKGIKEDKKLDDEKSIETTQSKQELRKTNMKKTALENDKSHSGRITKPTALSKEHREALGAIQQAVDNIKGTQGTLEKQQKKREKRMLQQASINGASDEHTSKEAQINMQKAKKRKKDSKHESEADEGIAQIKKKLKKSGKDTDTTKDSGESNIKNTLANENQEYSAHLVSSKRSQQVSTKNKKVKKSTVSELSTVQQSEVPRKYQEQKTVIPHLDEASESIKYSEVRKQALNALKQGMNRTTISKQQEQQASVEKKKESQVDKNTKKKCKKLPDEILENLSDVPFNAYKKRKLAASRVQIVPSRSMFPMEKVNLAVEDGYIPLSSSGGTTQFSVTNLQKLRRKSKKSLAVESFRQQMVSRNARHTVSAYRIALLKRKLTGEKVSG